jgi:hypothetical protein
MEQLSEEAERLAAASSQRRLACAKTRHTHMRRLLMLVALAAMLTGRLVTPAPARVIAYDRGRRRRDPQNSFKPNNATYPPLDFIQLQQVKNP